MEIIDGEMDSGKNFPTQPKDIYTKSRLYNTFGNYESETSAGFIVELCKQKNGWMPFAKDEIDAFSKKDFRFNNLTEGCSPVVVLGSDGRYRVTNVFIEFCKQSGDRNKQLKR